MNEHQEYPDAKPKWIPKTTIFIGNLSPTVTSENLIQAFEDIGPVKRAYSIPNKKGPREPAVGYVTFSDARDAEAALKVKTVSGRPVRIQYADPSCKVKRPPKRALVEQTKDVEHEDSPTPKSHPEIKTHPTEVPTANVKEEIQTHSKDGPTPQVKQKTKSHSKDVPSQVKPKTKTHLRDAPTPHVKPKIETNSNDGQGPSRRRTVMIKNLNYKATEGEVMDLVSPYGCPRIISQLTFKEDGTNTGYVIVVFDTPEEADTAQKTLDKKEFKGRPLNAYIYTRELVEARQKALNTDNRLVIIRNLPFSIHNEQLEKLLKKHGTIESLRVPTKPTGEKRGFCFVSYTEEKAATAAIEYLNSNLLLGRQVAADKAIGKKEHQEILAKKKPNNIKEDIAKTANGHQTVKSESESAKKKPDLRKDDAANLTNGHMRFDSDSESSDGEESESQDDAGGEDDDDAGDKTENKTDEETESENDSDESECETDDSRTDFRDIGPEDSDDEETKPKLSVKRKAEQSAELESLPKKKYDTSSSDVHEEKTLLVRNLAFETTEESLFEHFSRFGDLQYAKLTIDKHTQRSRGIGFVKFHRKEDAASCLDVSANPALESELTLDGRLLNVVIAVPREKVSEFSARKAEKQDKRNLYLARVGLVREGTEAAIGLSEADISRRLNLAKLKQNKLLNPCVFISPLRLSVHNLPVTVDDKELKEIIWKFTGDRKAWLTECRVIRDQNNVNGQGIARSRGFAFVAFDKHEHAMRALEALNNNPEVFGPQRRPIVEFAMENVKALQIKEKRFQAIQNTKQKRQQSENVPSTSSKVRDRRGRRHPVKSTKSPLESLQSVERPPDVQAGMPSHMGAKIRHNRNSGVPSSNDSKLARRRERKQEYEMSQRREKEDNKQPRPKKRQFNEEPDEFERLVTKYKSKLSGIKTSSKWFD